MKKEEIIKLIIEIVGEYTDITDIREESSFMDDLEMSSMEVFSFIGDLEDRLHIRIPERVLNKAATVEELADEITKLKA